jgi:hypothetical protein
MTMQALCKNCIDECLNCDAMIAFAEAEDDLRETLVELGIAMSVPEKPIFLIGNVLKTDGVFINQPGKIFVADSVPEAIKQIQTMLIH